MADAPAQHPAAPPATVADVMQPPVTAVEQNDHAAAAAYLMKRAGATALIVTKMHTRPADRDHHRGGHLSRGRGREEPERRPDL